MRVEAKLARMRKPQSFSVMPSDQEGIIIVQSEKSIGRFDFRTRKGVLNTKGHYFPHLSPLLGAVEYEFPEDFVDQCLTACPALDSVTNLGGVVLVRNTVKEIG